MANKHTKASQVIRHIQIKAIMRYHSTLTRMDIIKKTDNP